MTELGEFGDTVPTAKCSVDLAARILQPRRVVSSKHRRKVGRHSRDALAVRQSVISSSSRLR